MNPLTLQSQVATPFPLTPLQSNQRTIITVTKHSPTVFRPALPYLSHFNRRQNPIYKVVRSSLTKNEVLDAKDAALLVNTSITRNLGASLSLEQGLDKIRDAVNELRDNPPTCSSGMYRFQVAVPPSAKALNWFCAQPEESPVFPLFFLSNEKENATYKSLSLGRTRGVFGIGSAVTFQPSSSNAALGSLQRFIPAESTSSKAYGFLDVQVDTNASAVKQESGSSYLFIPHIELDEVSDISFLSATLAWDGSICSFDEALQTFDQSFEQARSSCANGSPLIRSSLSKSENVKEYPQMVRINSLLMDGKHLQSKTLEQSDESTSFEQFSARLSPGLSIANNMNQKDEADLVAKFTEECHNINLLWASLIVEECVRLGLTYFCVAPGSRSSPLTIAAASHPLTTCTACIDERSLAFHALGYAKGSGKPAVVITSSGTAVTNLIPAVVEASQTFVPMLLLTADRPTELVDVGANQAINQINHFGVYARHFFNLPPPTDEINAKYVLTAIDSAVFKTTSSPSGPIHVNCPFREPLGNSVNPWDRSCLRGLELWMSNAEPYTKYVPSQHSLTHNTMHEHMTEVSSLIQGAKNGVLLLGSIHKQDDMWAALLLAKHLSWPVVVDIQSGLRLRRYLSSFLGRKDILFVDQLDQLMVSDSFKSWIKADVIVQIGSRVTGRRLAQLVEHCMPCTYVMVDDHPGRHDPMNIMTHRIHSKITEFVNNLIRLSNPVPNDTWKETIRGLDMATAWETSFLINSEQSLTEPYVAKKIFEAVRSGSAVFYGNSMPIRDADMYGSHWVQSTSSASLMSSAGLECNFVHVTSNRGASGIDGLISTAIGFAVGVNKRVLMVIGDVSFLHDTNGLSLLRQQRANRKPMVILVVNNRGGAIFSQLPYANKTNRSIMDEFFYTTHNVSIRNLCEAHSVKHVLVQTKKQLQDALYSSQREDYDCVVEVESNLDPNLAFHSTLKNFTLRASNDAQSILSKLEPAETTSKDPTSKIGKMEYSKYRVQLNAPPTSASRSSNGGPSYREGFVISIALEDGSIGYGEVAPLEIHQENLLDVEEQLRFLIQAIEGNTIDANLALLKHSFSSWIWNNLGIPPSSIFPSVRCGLEMALLSAIGSKYNSSLLEIIHPGKEESSKESSSVQISGLIDSYASPEETAKIASKLVAEGFNTIKIKVARRSDPEEDIAVIREVRKKVGENIVLRADANRKWTYNQAVRFASSVKDCNLQYIEEPVNNEDEIVKFCEETSFPVALDETVNKIVDNPLEFLQKYHHSGIVAFVIKPGVIGGFENAALIARWAQQNGKMAVVSAAFESSLGLSAYVQFARYLDLQNAETLKLMKKESQSKIAHGLGTYKWFKEQVTSEPLHIHHNAHHGAVEANSADAGQFLRRAKINPHAIARKFSPEKVKEYQITVDASDSASFAVNVLETGESTDGNTVVFLHGFLGTGEDWIPAMKAMSASNKCISIDLPGHGKTKLSYQGKNISDRPDLSMDVMVDVLIKVLDKIATSKVTLVGYSMGARISLYTALKHSNKVEKAIIISGSPGLVDSDARAIRKAKDDFRASTLVSNGLKFFTEAWYAEELWTSLRSHPRFEQIAAKRTEHEDLHTLGKILSDLSIGRQPSLWEDLKQSSVPIQIIVGKNDAKFKNIAREMHARLKHEHNEADSSSEVVEIPNAGHAVHIENPLPVITAVREFIQRGKK